MTVFTFIAQSTDVDAPHRALRGDHEQKSFHTIVIADDLTTAIADFAAVQNEPYRIVTIEENSGFVPTSISDEQLLIAMVEADLLSEFDEDDPGVLSPTAPQLRDEEDGTAWPADESADPLEHGPRPLYSGGGFNDTAVDICRALNDAGILPGVFLEVSDEEGGLTLLVVDHTQDANRSIFLKSSEVTVDRDASGAAGMLAIARALVEQASRII